MANVDLTRVASNLGALNALNALQQINSKLAIHQARLASGKRINSAADDPAGLTIATKLFARSEGLKVALDNIADAKNLLAVAESGLGRINDILIQIRNKAEAGASDTMGEAERDALLAQMKAYAAQIDDIVAQTKWNNNSLIDGTYFASGLTFQTGADQNDTTVLTGLKNMKASAVGGLNIAEVTTTARSATEVADPASFVSAASAAAPSNSLLSELETGEYTVEVAFGAAIDGGHTVKLHKGSSTGALELIDANNDPADEALNNFVTIADLTGGVAVDFGNGLTVNLQWQAGNASSTKYATIQYTQSSTEYAVKTQSGTTLAKTSSASVFAEFMNDIQGKLDEVSSQLSLIGSLTGRMTFKEEQVANAQINVEASYNRIMNANMAEEQVNASKYLILQQTATAMLAQANTAPQFLLSLFR